MDENERDSLDDMKRQSYQDSLAAKQAYINALEFHIRELREGIKEIINYSSNYSAYIYLAEMREKLRKLVEKEKP